MSILNPLGFLGPQLAVKGMSMTVKLIISAIIAVVAAVAIWYVAYNIVHPFGWGTTKSLKNEVAAAEANVEVAKGQTAAGADAAVIADKGATREDRIRSTRSQNREVIIAAPGANTPLDPALVAAGIRALCMYDDLYAADPQCSEMRAASAAAISRPD